MRDMLQRRAVATVSLLCLVALGTAAVAQAERTGSSNLFTKHSAVANSAAFNDFLSGKMEHRANRYHRVAAEVHNDFIDWSETEEYARQHRMEELRGELAALKMEMLKTEKDSAEFRDVIAQGNPDALADQDTFRRWMKSEVARVQASMDQATAQIAELEVQSAEFTDRLSRRQSGERVNKDKPVGRAMEAQAGSPLDAGAGSFKNTTLCNSLSDYSAAAARVFSVCQLSGQNFEALLEDKNDWYNETAATIAFEGVCNSECLGAMSKWLADPVTSQCSGGISSTWKQFAAFCKKNPSSGKRCGVEFGLVGRFGANSYSTERPCSRQFSEANCLNTSLATTVTNESCTWTGGSCILNKTDALMDYECNDYCVNTYANYTGVSLSERCLKIEDTYCEVEKSQRLYGNSYAVGFIDGALYNSSNAAIACTTGNRLCYRFNTKIRTSSSLKTAYSSLNTCMLNANYFTGTSFFFTYLYTEAACLSAFSDTFNRAYQAAVTLDSRCSARPDGKTCSTVFSTSTTNGGELSNTQITRLRALAGGSSSSSFYQTCNSSFYTSTDNDSLDYWLRFPASNVNPYDALPRFQCCFEYDAAIRTEIPLQSWLAPVRTYYSLLNYDERFNDNSTFYTPRNLTVNASNVPAADELSYRLEDGANCLNISSDAFTLEATTACTQVTGGLSETFEVQLNLNWTKLADNTTLRQDMLTHFVLRAAEFMALEAATNIREPAIQQGTANSALNLENPVKFSFKVWSRDPAVAGLFATTMFALLLETPSTFSDLFDKGRDQAVNVPMCSVTEEGCFADDYPALSNIYGVGDSPIQLTPASDDIPDDLCFTQQYYDMYSAVFESCVISNETRAFDEDTTDLYFDKESAQEEWTTVCNGHCRANLLVFRDSVYLQCLDVNFQKAIVMMEALCTTGNDGNFCGVAYSLAQSYRDCGAKSSESRCNRSATCRWSEAREICEVYASHDNFWEDGCDQTCVSRVTASLMSSSSSEIRQTAMVMRAFCARDASNNLCMPQLQDDMYDWMNEGTNMTAINASISGICGDDEKKKCLFKVWNGYSNAYVAEYNSNWRSACTYGDCQSTTSTSLTTSVTRAYRYRNLALNFCDSKTDDDASTAESPIYCSAAFAHWNQKSGCFANITRNFAESSSETCDAPCADALAPVYSTFGCCAPTIEQYVGISTSSFTHSNMFSTNRDATLDIDFPQDPTANPTPVPPTPVPTTTPATTEGPTFTFSPDFTFFTPSPSQATTFDSSLTYYNFGLEDLYNCRNVQTSTFSSFSSWRILRSRCTQSRDYKDSHTRSLTLPVGIRFSVLGSGEESSSGVHSSTSALATQLLRALAQDVATNLGIPTDAIQNDYFSRDASQVVTEASNAALPATSRRQTATTTADSGSTYNFAVRVGTEAETDAAANTFDTQLSLNNMALPLTVNTIETDCEPSECTVNGNTDSTGIQVAGVDVVALQPESSGVAMASGSTLVLLVVTIASALFSSIV